MKFDKLCFEFDFLTAYLVQKVYHKFKISQQIVMPELRTEQGPFKNTLENVDRKVNIKLLETPKTSHTKWGKEQPEGESTLQKNRLGPILLKEFKDRLKEMLDDPISSKNPQQMMLKQLFERNVKELERLGNQQTVMVISCPLDNLLGNININRFETYDETTFIDSSYYPLTSDIAHIQTCARERKFGKDGIGTYINSQFLQIRYLSNHQEVVKNIYLTTNAQEPICICNYVTIDQALFYYQREQEYDRSKKIFTTSFLRMFCFSFVTNETMPMPEFDIDEGSNRFEVNFISDTFEESRYTLVIIGEPDQKHAEFNLFDSMKKLNEKVEVLKKRGITDFMLIDNKLKRAIKHEIGTSEEILQLAKNERLVTCKHFMGDEKNCTTDCYIEAIKNLYIVKRSQNRYAHMYYPRKVDEKNTIISLRSSQKPIFESESQTLGACLKRVLKKVGDKLKEQIILEIHEGTKRTRAQYDTSDEEPKLQEKKMLQDKTSSEFFRRFIDLQKSNSGVKYFFDDSKEIILTFFDGSAQEKEEAIRSIKQEIGRIDGTEQDLLKSHSINEHTREVNSRIVYRDQNNFKNSFPSEGYELHDMFKKHDEISLTLRDGAKLKKWIMKERNSKIFSLKEASMNQGFNEQVRRFLQAYIECKYIKQFNSIFTNMACNCSPYGSEFDQIVEFNIDTGKIEIIGVRNPQFRDGLMHVQDDKGLYMSFAHQRGFFLQAKITNGYYYLFVFVHVVNGINTTFLVMKTLDELKELGNKLIIWKDDYSDGIRFIKNKVDDGIIRLTSNKQEAMSGSIGFRFQTFLNKIDNDFLAFIIGARNEDQYVCVVDVKLQNISSQKIIRTGVEYHITQSSQTSYFVYDQGRSQTYEFEINDKHTLETRLTSIGVVQQKYKQKVCIPNFKQNNEIDGVIMLCGEKWPPKDAVIEIKRDTAAKYQSKVQIFGDQKFCAQNDDEPENQIRIVRSYLTEDFKNTAEFTQREGAFALETIMQTLFNQIPFSIWDHARFDSDFCFNEKDQDCQPLEALFGQSYVDAYLPNKHLIQKRLSQERGKEIKLNIPPIFRQHKGNQMFFDYQLDSTLTKALHLSSSSTVGLLISKIQEMGDKDLCRNICMANIMDCLELKDVPTQIVQILRGGHFKENFEEVLSIQKPINGVAELSDVTQEFIEINEEVPIHLSLEEFVKTKLQQRQKQKKEENKVLDKEVQHSVVDFGLTLFKSKLEAFTKDENGQFSIGDFQKISHLYISDLIQQLHPFPNVFLTHAIIDLMQMHAQRSIPFFKGLFGFFTSLYVIPFLLYSLQSDPNPLLLGISFFASLALLILEIPQMRAAGGLQYFKDDPWNIQDIGSFIIFLVYLLNQWSHNFVKQDDSLLQVILGQAILILSLLKTLFFLRVYQKFGSLVQMLFTTMAGLVNFMVFLFLSVGFFAVSLHMLNATFSSSDYPDLGSFFIILIQTFRNSIGDIATPIYDSWSDLDDSKTKKYAAIGLIWSVWFYCQLFNLIILLNFLIAVISQNYDQVISEQMLCSFKYISDFNREYFTISEFISEKYFTILIFSEELDKSHEFTEDVNLGIVKNVGRIVDKKVSQMTETLSKQSMQVKEEVAKVNMKTDAIQEEVKAQTESFKAKTDAIQEEFKAETQAIKEEVSKVREELNYKFDKLLEAIQSKIQ